MCIVGRVGTGKSALLAALINEMKQTKGHIRFGGRINYGERANGERRELIVCAVPQQAWVQSGTVQDNITFSSTPGQADTSRIDSVIDACGLRPDIDMWPEGKM